MSDTWLLLKFLDQNLDQGYNGPPYAIEERMEFDQEPQAGVELPLSRGGWVKILWVDRAHHQVGVERVYPSSPWRSNGRHA